MRFSLVYFLLSFVSLLVGTSVAAVIGVDYGQQYIKAMVVSPQAPLELILTPESKRKDVSGLAIRGLGGGSIERLYGSSVGSIATRYPKNSLLHSKPLLGKTLGDEIDMRLYLKEHPGVEVVSTGRNSLAFLVDGVQYPIEELTAMSIQEIINRANNLLKEKDPAGIDPVDKLALTLPGFFNQHQRRALLDVGSITSDSLETCLVNDGLSVMINFAFTKRDFVPGEPQYYIVYDMGGGSTRASLFSILQPLNETEPLKLEFGGYGYDAHLGGSKFTLEVASLIENKFLETHKNIRTDALHANPKALAKIIQAAEKAKLILSANTEAFVSIESLFDAIDFKTTISRQEFEDFIQDSVADIMQPIEDAMNTQMWPSIINIRELSGVLLTGGSSRVPIVQQQLSTMLGEDRVLKSVNADESVVNGATIRSVKLFNAFKTKSLDIVERCLYNYAIKLNDEDSEEIVFPKGHVYPAQRVLTLDGLNDISENITIDLFENDKLFQTVTVKAGAVEKGFTHSVCPKGVVYNATLSISQNGLFELDKIEAICLKEDVLQNDEASEEINVEAVKSKIAKINRSTRLEIAKKDVPIKRMSFEEKKRLRAHINSLEHKDKERFELEEAKNLLEGLLYETRGFLESESIAENGPKAHLEKLEKLIPDYLAWLEDESDGASKTSIMSKTAEINDLKSKIEVYVQSLTEPLDSKQFKGMLDSAHELSENFSEAKGNDHEGLSLLGSKFSDLGYDAQQEYSNINLPYYLSNSLKGWNETLNNFNEVVASLEELVVSDAVDESNREDLFETKLAFDAAYAELEKKTNLFKKGRDYRFRELLSWLQRTEKAKKRKDEKIKKSLGDLEEENKEGQISQTKSSTPEPEPTIISSVTSVPTLTKVEADSSITVEATRFHDEL